MLKTAADIMSSDNGVGADSYLGRAIVIDASLSGMAIRIGVEQYRVCTLRLQVFLDGNPAYIAECKQKVQEWRLGHLVGHSFAVRVKRSNGQQVALDFSAEAPILTMSRPPEGTSV